ncbi:MAG: hypothetical protein GKR88_01165 [Flavobacteriaceae bacterium]|nr:MAG: hypothetical protein GKR88_01165 [Flavobacteriaceae bacterium]
MDKYKYVFFISSCLFITNDSYSQCAMCKAVVENGDQPMAEGINLGITYLMAFPYVLVGVLFYFLYKYRKKIKN